MATVDELFSTIDEAALVVKSHISEVRLEACMVDTYHQVSRSQREVALTHLKDKIEALVHETRRELTTLQMQAVLSIYNDVLASVRSISLSSDNSTLDSADALTKLRDITELTYNNSKDLFIQEEQSKTSKIPDYFGSV